MTTEVKYCYEELLQIVAPSNAMIRMCILVLVFPTNRTCPIDVIQIDWELCVCEIEVTLFHSSG
jgi:hypothetical protein